MCLDIGIWRALHLGIQTIPMAATTVDISSQSEASTPDRDRFEEFAKPPRPDFLSA
jgi:hypothetical protein